MKVCLYIPCRNGEATLPFVFEAVARQTRKPDCLLLINDGSTDNTATLARAAGWAIVETSKERNGLSAGRNMAVKFARENGCEVVAGIDADAVPAPDYVETLDSFYNHHPEIAGTCGNMQERFTETPSDLWRSVHMRQHWGTVPVNNPVILFGSSAAHRVSVLLAMGGFNESLRTNFEDSEMTQRLLAAGHKLAYVPTLSLEHLKRDTPDSVLKMYWSWYLPPADLRGQLSNSVQWINVRLPWIWSDYRFRSRSDTMFPRLTALTMALPWVQIMRDLSLIASRSNLLINLTEIVEQAKTVHHMDGCRQGLIDWIHSRLEFVLEQTGTKSGNELNPILLNAIRDGALESFPRRSFWNALDESADALGISR